VAVATPGVGPALSDREAVSVAVPLVTLGVTSAGAADVPTGVSVGAPVACAAEVDVAALDVELAADVVVVIVTALVVVVVVTALVVVVVVEVALVVVVVVADAGGLPAGGVPLPKDQPSADPAGGTYCEAPRVAYCQAPQLPSALRVACQ